MLPFSKFFPDLGQRETRSAQVLDDPPSLPRGEYAFLELYCEEPDCDCRRVLLQVRPRENPERVLATISFGWESTEFYARRLGGDPRQGREAASATLDPLLEQSEHAPALLRLFKEQFLTDPDYVRRLKDHYRMFKEAVKHSPATNVPTESPSFGKAQIETQRSDGRTVRNPSFDRLEELMQQGYRELEQRRDAAACEIWIGAADLFLSLYRDGPYFSLEAFDAVFSGTQFVSNWMHDLMEALHNAGLDRPAFNEHRVRLAAEFLESVGTRHPSLQESLRRELASGWTKLGRRDRSDALYAEWLKDDPEWGWGWIGWADTYFHCRSTERNAARARELLLQGLGVEAVRDRADLIERQSNIEESDGRMIEARALRQTADALRASRVRSAKPTPVRAAPTVGRNEPCPCGSGKKYKKCCGR